MRDFISPITIALARDDQDAALREYLVAVDTLIAELATVDDSALPHVHVGQPLPYVWTKMLERDRAWVERHGVTDGAVRNLTAIARTHTKLQGFDIEAA